MSDLIKCDVKEQKELKVEVLAGGCLNSNYYLEDHLHYHDLEYYKLKEHLVGTFLHRSEVFKNIIFQALLIL